ncbi:DHA1 family bicyclomycin/chloramphenicol resistance-like MFS transporter [Lipingzhangella halophila]|uniref:DHA1 family bicyclomycin/chloramphenicol resistance-like MFS transporter n=1 Tax=Lipingzhangella halophila TaxID=1783352 RepID=A0A7W7RNF8_9ACTN|nr:multidrug effflux MFS transporter [Lipingzhangella halophila]MBB4934957.1 DHA1 family bicyclomycin/chloramphenicol resistance-like MFS transporter [Lipingzhangella halophila]
MPSNSTRSRMSEPGTGERRGAGEEWRIRLLILVLAGLTAVAPFATDIYVPAFPELAASLSADDSTVQLSMTMFLIGLAGGQLVLGPLSDSLGRRRVLLFGTAAFLVLSLVCAMAPSIEVFNLARVLQGVAGAAGIVVARAVITDRFQGAAAARHFSALASVVFVAPVVAPVLGGALLGLGPWHVLFVALAAFGLLLLAGVLAWVPESLPTDQRRSGGLPSTLRAMATLLTRRVLVGYLIVLGMCFAAFFAYISGATFVFQDIYGVSATQFSLIFAANAVGMLVGGQVFGRMASRVRPRTLLGSGLGTALAATAVLTAVLASGAGNLGVTWGCLMVTVTGFGITVPAIITIVQDLGDDAPGATSGLVGFGQFALGAGGAPLTGLFGTSSVLPMALIMLSGVGLAMLAFATVARPSAT